MPQAFRAGDGRPDLASRWDWAGAERVDDDRAHRGARPAATSAPAGGGGGPHPPRWHARAPALAGGHQHRATGPRRWAPSRRGAACSRRSSAGRRTWRIRPAPVQRRLHRGRPMGRRGAVRVASAARGGLPHRWPLSARPVSPPHVRAAQQRHRRARHRPAGMVRRLQLRVRPGCRPARRGRHGAPLVPGRPDGPAPQRVLDPARRCEPPEVHLGMLFGDLDDAPSRRCTTTSARACCSPQARGAGGWVESASARRWRSPRRRACSRSTARRCWAPRCSSSTPAGTPPPGGPWYDTVGDWNVDRDRFPDGVAPFRDHVQRAGHAVRAVDGRRAPRQRQPDPGGAPRLAGHRLRRRAATGRHAGPDRPDGG